MEKALSKIKELTDVEVWALKQGHEGLTIIDFHSTWCHPCRNLAPVLEGFADEYNIVKVDVDKCPDSTKSYGVRGIPTLVALKDGNVIGTKTGLIEKDILASWFADCNK